MKETRTIFSKNKELSFEEKRYFLKEMIKHITKIENLDPTYKSKNLYYICHAFAEVLNEDYFRWPIDSDMKLMFPELYNKIISEYIKSINGFSKDLDFIPAQPLMFEYGEECIKRINILNELYEELQENKAQKE